MFLFIWNDKWFEYSALLEGNCSFQSTLKVRNIRCMKNMLSSREINISASRQYRDSYVKVHSLTDLLCPKFSLSFSPQIVSLQSMHCCFRRVSLYGKTHTFWFIHMMTVDVMVSSQKYLCSQPFWSRNGLPCCLARWNYPLVHKRDGSVQREWQKKDPGGFPGCYWEHPACWTQCAVSGSPL